MPPTPVQRLTLATIARSLRLGWQRFRNDRLTSIAYALPFAGIALLLWLIIGHLQATPMALAVSGGFMLVGPILLGGYFELADCMIRNEPAKLSHAMAAYRRAPPGLWAIGAVCALFYLIWITDAATLYGFMVGGSPTGAAAFLIPGSNVRTFALWSSLMGAVLAFIIFAVATFSVPLLHYRRAQLIEAVMVSVKTVF
ncbi:MAG: DUF2189 domain-containing protein, partial [Betaproteobacteria bacterium]|nr:DUF2189 domain-containing protein [Betaproteobacteria bacterium]